MIVLTSLFKLLNHCALPTIAGAMFSYVSKLVSSVYLAAIIF